MKNLLKTAAAGVPPQTKVFFLGLFLMMSVMTLLRLGFFVVNKASFSLSYPLILVSSFLNGLRFDLHVILFATGPFFLLLHIPGGWKNFFHFSRRFSWIPLFLFLIGLALCLVNIHYYTEAGRHLSYEIFQVGGEAYDLKASLKMIWQYKGTILVFAFASGFLVLIWKTILKKCWENTSKGWVRELVWLFVFLPVMTFGVKGNIRGKPLRTSDAFSQGRTELGHLALNPLFTIGRNLVEFPDDLPEHYPEKEAFKTVRELLDSPDTVWLEENSPVLRKNGSFPENPEKLLNLVVLVLESWSNVNIGAYGSSKGLSPEFDKLADNGFLFENFFAVGNRTIEGLAAICIGIPSFNHFNHMTKGSFLSGSLEQNRYKGIGSIFGERGYSTVFLHGESSKTFRQSSLARLAGFQKHLGIEELKIKPGETSGPWGLWDHVMMDRLLEVTESEPEPFLAVWMSLSNHPPYVLPDDTFKTARPGDEDGQFGDTLRYTDHFLGRFFEKAKERDFFKNTVFVITADHCARSISTMESRYRIPLLVYAPGIVAPGVGKEVGSQLGFIPSMLDLLGIGAGHHAMGNSLFDRQAQRFAFLNFAQGYGWVSDNLFFEMDPDGGVTGVFDLDSGESFVGGLSGNREKLLSFLQVGKTMLLRNQFVPAP